MSFLLALMSCVLVSGCISPAPLPTSAAQTKAAKASPQRREFLQDARQRINPSDRDYGESIEEWRARTVHHSLASPFFWTMAANLGVLALALAALVHERNQRARQEAIAAEFLAQYHNAWVHARRQAREAIARHNALVEKTNRATEATELLTFSVSATKTEPEREPAASASTVFLKGNLRPRSDVPTAGDPRPGQKLRNLRQPEPDLLAQIHTLQEQLDASCERERHLERELKKGSRPPAPEQRVNV